MSPSSHDQSLLHRLQATSWQAGWLLPPPLPENGAAGITVKVGGSLLTRRDWPQLLGGLLNASNAPLQIIVGGGRVVDGLRQLDAASPQPAERMHRLAIAAMTVTALMVAEELGLPMCREPMAAASHRHGVILPETWQARGGFAGLPASWEVTSDSLAAIVAATVGQPLLLVKSVRPPHDCEPPPMSKLAEAGWVDPYFPRAADRLSGLAWAAPPAVLKA